MAPGSYTVSARVVDLGKKGKHQQMADCQASFKVIEVPKIAPKLSVSAEPSAVTAGDSSVITASGSSADNRPLSYNCTATAGQLIGNGPRYTLETAGVPEGTVEVNCTVSDNINQTASASVPVRVTARAKVAAAVTATRAKSYGTIGFQRDVRRPTRVDNEAKGELDRYADALAAAPDTKGVVVGYATAKEDKAMNGGKSFAAQRAVNTKDYLTKEKGIDPARIEARAGNGDQKVELWIVPPGAVFPQSDTTAVDEVVVKAVPRVALKKKRAAHRRVPKQDKVLPQGNVAPKGKVLPEEQ
jgi:outer membrane protein OmpA-like peptidoglycan-associated protein